MENTFSYYNEIINIIEEYGCINIHNKIYLKKCRFDSLKRLIGMERSVFIYEKSILDNSIVPINRFSIFIHPSLERIVFFLESDNEVIRAISFSIQMDIENRREVICLLVDRFLKHLIIYISVFMKFILSPEGHDFKFKIHPRRMPIGHELRIFSKENPCLFIPCSQILFFSRYNRITEILMNDSIINISHFNTNGTKQESFKY